MTFAEFYSRLKTIADGEHFVAEVQASEYGVEWRAYVQGPGWTPYERPRSAEEALRVIALMKAEYVPPSPAPKPDPEGLDGIGEAANV
jgi:hypothetical protein